MGKALFPGTRVTEGSEFLKRVAYGFSVIAHQNNWTRISAELNQSLVSKQIQEALMQYET